MNSHRISIGVARLMIGMVVFFNLQCAALFIFNPIAYAPMFELSGLPGQVAVQGFGILFIMWNVPYIIALADPTKHFLSLIEALIMQAIGVVGESLLYASLPTAYSFIRISVFRFIWFDAGGLLALLLSVWIIQSNLKNK